MSQKKHRGLKGKVELLKIDIKSCLLKSEKGFEPETVPIKNRDALSRFAFIEIVYNKKDSQ
ncbi:hypothetical protein IW22_16740 [Chryseobacterium sp. JM1]|nr:hypothetical protein IW22_16740 [Chryseobacterium sp. JM1]